MINERFDEKIGKIILIEVCIIRVVFMFRLVRLKCVFTTRLPFSIYITYNYDRS